MKTHIVEYLSGRWNALYAQLDVVNKDKKFNIVGVFDEDNDGVAVGDLIYVKTPNNTLRIFEVNVILNSHEKTVGELLDIDYNNWFCISSSIFVLSEHKNVSTLMPKDYEFDSILGGEAILGNTDEHIFNSGFYELSSLRCDDDSFSLERLSKFIINNMNRAYKDKEFSYVFILISDGGSPKLKNMDYLLPYMEAFYPEFESESDLSILLFDRFLHTENFPEGWKLDGETIVELKFARVFE